MNGPMTTVGTLLVGWTVACAAAAPEDRSDAVLPKQAAWKPADPANVRSQVWAWLDSLELDPSVQARARALWPEADEDLTGGKLMDRIAAIASTVDENARQLVELCAEPRRTLAPPSAEWLFEASTPPIVGNNLRLLYGRWLARDRLFDEAKVQLDGLRPDDVVDPASLLFYQAVVYHRLLEREAGLEAIDSLLDGAAASPERYVAVARLMKADLSRLNEDSLDHIARRMEDIGRRLDLGRAGPRVREIEDGVIESLDKLIKEIEDRQQQSAGGANNVQSSSPAQDSRILGGKGPGEVTKKAIGNESGWGNLPPKERERAMQQIGREFPFHYRDAIEQYFRKLAGRQSEGE